MRTRVACLGLVLLAGGCMCCGERGGYGPAPGPASQVLSQERHSSPSEAERRALVASSNAQIQRQVETSGGTSTATERKVEYVDGAPSATYLR